MHRKVVELPRIPLWLQEKKPFGSIKLYFGQQRESHGGDIWCELVLCPLFWPRQRGQSIEHHFLQLSCFRKYFHREPGQMGWQGLLERQEMESKFCQWETFLLVAGCSSSGPSFCGHGCTLVLWKVNVSGGPCLYSLPEVTEILWKIEKTVGQGFALDKVAATDLCFMGLVLGWKDCFWTLWNLPSVGFRWQMESAKGMALKTSPKSSSGVTPYFWYDVMKRIVTSHSHQNIQSDPSSSPWWWTIPTGTMSHSEPSPLIWIWNVLCCMNKRCV